MVSRRPTPAKPESPDLSPDQLRMRIGRLQDCIRALGEFDPQKVQKRYSIPEVMELEASIKGALAAAFGDGTPAYNRYKRSASLDNGPHMARMGTAFGRGPAIDYDARDAQEARQYLTEGKQQSIGLLQDAIRTLEYEIADQEHRVQAAAAEPKALPALDGSKVFVVHGHDEAALQAMARFLEKIGLEAIILREQPDQGRTIIEKFEDCAGDVGFAVVLLTPDDIGGVPTAAARARQNVIFELGYFAGKLGRGRACLVRKRDVEIPSDLYGVIYTEMDDGEGWKLKLVKELIAAKLDFDANRMWR